MPTISAKQFENKKRFYHLLFEAFLHYQHLVMRAVSEQQKQLAERAGWRRDSSENTAELNAVEIVRSHVGTEQVDLHIPVLQVSNPIFMLQNNLRSAAAKVKQQIRADGNIKDEHKDSHEQAVDFAFCVDNPVDLLHRLQRAYEVMSKMTSSSSREQKDAHISKYLASSGQVDARGELSQEKVDAQFEQQLRADFDIALAKQKPTPHPENLDNMAHDQFEDLLELAIRSAYFQRATTLMNSPVITDRIAFVDEGRYVARTYLNRSNFNNINLYNLVPTPRPESRASLPYSAWMRFFQDYQNGPYAPSMRPGFGTGERHLERESKNSFSI